MERLYTFKNKSYLLALTVQWRAFNIHGNFPIHKRFNILEKGSLEV